MINPIFDEVDETKIIGSEIDGNVVLFSPVPEGDAYDDLWDTCCRTFEKHPRLKGKLNEWFAENTETGQHTSWLGDEVALWVKQGNLREHVQVNGAVTEFADHWDRLVRLGVINSWLVDLGTIKQFRWFFGVQGSKPLPSKTEYIEEQTEWQKQQQEQYEKTAAKQRSDKKILEAYEAELARELRVKALVQRIAEKLWSFDGLDLNADPLPIEYDERSKKRRRYKKCPASTYEIEELVDAGKSDIEIEEGAIMNFISALKAAGQSEVPALEDGELRKFFTENEFTQFLASGDYGRLMEEYGESSLMVGLDGLFVATLRPRTPFTKAELEALAKSRKTEVSNSLGGRCA